MATAAETITPQATDIVAIVEANPIMVLTDREKYNQFYDAIKRETDALEIDLTTEKGRKAIASMAYKVARTKTAIDDAGKKLNEEWRARINATDEARREIRQQLDALKEEVRRPLTEWEKAEEERIAECEATLASLRGAATVSIEETSADVRLRLAAIQEMNLDPERFGEYMPQAVNLRDQTISSLTAAVARLDKEEAERAELEKLRAEAIERERQEQERREAEAAEQRRQEAEKAEAERLEKLRAEAADRARKEAEAAARKEREERDRQHSEALEAERRRAEEAERAAQAERDRITREEDARRAEQQRLADEQAKRDADRAHRSRVMAAAKEAIMETADIAEDAAKKVVLAIVGGNIPNVALRF